MICTYIGAIKIQVMKHRNTSNSKSLNQFRLDTDIFVGFKPACEACDLNWDDYPLAGITYGTSCCCEFGTCVHAKLTGTAAHFMGNHANWNESSRVSLNILSKIFSKNILY